MSLAAVLVKPQVLAEPPAEVKGDELQLIADLIRALARNPQVAQAVGDIVADEFNNQMRAFLVSREERLRFAYGKGRNIFSPFETAIQTLINDLQDDIFEAIPTILSLAKQMADGLSLNGVKSFINDLWDLAENDLEISGDALRQLVNTLFTGVIARLQQPFNDGDSSDDAIAQYDFGCAVDNLRDFVLDELVIPRIDKQLVLSVITKIWRQYKIDENLQTVSQVLAAGDEIIEPLSEIAQCIISQIAASSNTDRNNPVPLSDNSSFAGFADWGAARDVNDENTTMAWYASWVAGRNVKYSSNTTQSLNIYDNPELMGFTYENISRETMERIAFHTAWIVPLLETIPHLASLEKGDLWSNLTNIFANGIDSLLIGWPKFNLPKWAHWTGLPIYTMLAGFEGHEERWEMPGDDDPYIWTNILGDVGEAYMYRRISWTAREALLSILTLINNDPQTAQRRNKNYFHGLGYFFGELLVMMVPGIISETEKKNYGFIGGGPSTQTWVCGFVGAAVTWFMEYFLSASIGHALAGEKVFDRLDFWLLPFRERCIKGMLFSDLWGEDAQSPDAIFSDFWRAVHNDKYPWWRDALQGTGITILMLIGLGQRVADSLLYLYLFTDGDTEDGTYCMDTTGVKRRFVGYPDKSSSPYLLPWKKDKNMQCVQGNMGIWSHFPEGRQTYAYDFSHKEGELVLCTRAGLVRNSRDDQQDHNPDHWNFIQIIHVIEIPPDSNSVIEIPPKPDGTPGTVSEGFIRCHEVYSPYTGRRRYSDPAPAIPGSGGMVQYEGTTTDIPLDVVFPVVYPLTPSESAARPAGTSYAFPEGLIRCEEVYSPYSPTGRCHYSDPAPTAPGSGGMKKYKGTTTDIPLDVVFPAYPDGTNPEPRESAARPAGTSYAFINTRQDRAIAGKTFPSGAKYSDKDEEISNDVVFVPNLTGIPATSDAYTKGTTFLPPTPYVPKDGWPAVPARDFEPLLATYGVYGHGLEGFINRVFGPNLTRTPDGGEGTAYRASDIEGEYIQQGIAVMEAGDTGVSAYNHLHMHVIGIFTTNGNDPHRSFTIPFVYKDEGQVKAMNYYTSTNERMT